MSKKKTKEQRTIATDISRKPGFSFFLDLK
jgi:hypothetical protein